MHACASYSSRPTGSDFTKRRRREVDGAIERPLFCCPALWSRTAVSWQVVTLAVKFEMCTIHRIANICITAKLKTGVCIIHRCALYPRLYGNVRLLHQLYVKGCFCLCRCSDENISKAELFQPDRQHIW